ncbi:MAG: DUF4956 domain-containing protein [Spirochaetota bacterium]
MMTRIRELLAVSPERLTDFGVSLVLAIGLGFGIAALYRYTHRSMNYESSFPQTLVLLTPIVTIVMFFIQGDLVLSLGLVGSLSIVRFRTPIKDTKDMVFLFWAIVTGLGTGTLHWTLALLATGVLSLLMTLFTLVRYGRRTHSEFILIVSGDLPYEGDMITDLLAQAAIPTQIRSHELVDESWELTYELTLGRGMDERVHEAVSRVHRLEGVRRVSLLTPQLTLPA